MTGRPGNGGVLQYPKGQTSVLFDVEKAVNADIKDKDRSLENQSAATTEVENDKIY